MLSGFENACHTEEHNNNRKIFRPCELKYAEPKEEEILGSYVNEKPLNSIMPLGLETETKRGSKSATGKEIGTARYSRNVRDEES